MQKPKFQNLFEFKEYLQDSKIGKFSHFRVSKLEIWKKADFRVSRLEIWKKSPFSSYVNNLKRMSQNDQKVDYVSYLT